MSYQDKSIICSDCNATFTFTADEQEQYASRGYTNEPKRCPTCRATRKAQQGRTGTGSFGNSNSYSNGSGYAPRREMFSVKCSECGKDAQVPFEPRQGRPVYCSDCYRKVRR